MITTAKATELNVCFKDRLKNCTIVAATHNISEARRIARIWGKKTEGEPVKRTVFRKAVPISERGCEIIDGIKVWPPLF